MVDSLALTLVLKMSHDHLLLALVLGCGAAARDSVSLFLPNIRGYVAHLSGWRRADLKTAFDRSSYVLLGYVHEIPDAKRFFGEIYSERGPAPPHIGNVTVPPDHRMHFIYIYIYIYIQ